MSITRIDTNEKLLDATIAAELLLVRTIGQDGQLTPVADRAYLYETLIRSILEQAKAEGMLVQTDYEDIDAETLSVTLDDTYWFEECPECGHREESDGYGGTDCPECNHAMQVHRAADYGKDVA
jgi:tRNA(Ile2) C34 agmatinyltransferase TiaS